MTGYYISIGYNSGYSAYWDEQSAWNYLKQIVGGLTKEEIKSELCEYQVYDEDIYNVIDEYIDKYFSGEDLTIRICESNDENLDKEVVQLASGSGMSRKIKEGLRRAVCRRILHHAHQANLEININVR